MNSGRELDAKMFPVIDRIEPFGSMYGEAVIIASAPNDYIEAFGMFLRTKVENAWNFLKAHHGESVESAHFPPDQSTVKIHDRQTKQNALELWFSIDSTT